MFAQKIKTVTAVAVALGVAGWLNAGVVNAAPIVITTNHQPDNTSSGIYSNTAGTAGDSTTWQYVGHASISSAMRVYRYVAIFKLPDLPSGQTIESVTFSNKLVSITGTPGDTALYHLPKVNQAAVDPTFFQSTPANQVSGWTMTATSPTGAYYTADVTTQVESDYTNDPAASRYATFRLQVPGDSISATQTDRYTLGDATLTIATKAVPEPASLTVLAVGGLMLLQRRTK